jgi:hypothetical protein
MREGGAIDGLLFVASVLLIGVGVAGVVMRARNAGRFGRLGGIGMVASIGGGSLILVAILVQAIVFEGDMPYMPFFLVPGGVAVIIGMLLLGIAILRAGVLPRWVAALLIVGALAMLGFNDQNVRSLIAIPFGVAWMAVGYALWSGQTEHSYPLVR